MVQDYGFKHWKVSPEDQTLEVGFKFPKALARRLQGYRQETEIPYEYLFA